MSAKKLKNFSNDTNNKPAISVIVPMYNVEKYIGACLDSIIHQTFTDYEVVVVDDCSTDKSIEIVKSFLPRLGDKLRIVKRKKNAGAAAMPRNDGIKAARGKYLTFVDSDDLIMLDALEVLYKAAEETQADVVHVENSLVPAEGVLDKDIDSNTKFVLWNFQTKPPVEKMTVVTEDMAERVGGFCRREFIWWACNKLFRRKFIMDNKIEFPDMKVYEDMIFLFKCLCLSKIYVRIPNVIYIYRVRTDSMSQRIYSVEDAIKKDVYQFTTGTRLFDKFMNGNKFFKDNPQFKHMVLELFDSLQTFDNYYTHCEPNFVDEIIRRELINNSGDNTALITYLIHKIFVGQAK